MVYKGICWSCVLIVTTIFWLSTPKALAQDDYCLAYTTPQNALVSVNISSGHPTALLPEEQVDTFSISPDGERIIYIQQIGELARTYLFNGEIVIDLNIDEVIHPNRSLYLFAQWSSTSDFVLIKNDSLYLTDAHTGETVVLSHNNDIYIPRWSPDGTRVAYPEQNEASNRLQIYDVNDQETISINIPTNANDFPWSPDGAKIAFVSQQAWTDAHIYVLDLSTDELKVYGEHGSGTGELQQQIVGWLADGSGLLYFAGEYRFEHILYQLELEDGAITPVLTFENWDFAIPNQTAYPLYVMALQFGPGIAVLDDASAEPRLLANVPSIFYRASTYSTDYRYFAFNQLQDEHSIIFIDLNTGEAQALSHPIDEQTDIQWIPCL